MNLKSYKVSFIYLSLWNLYSPYICSAVSLFLFSEYILYYTLEINIKLNFTLDSFLNIDLLNYSTIKSYFVNEAYNLILKKITIYITYLNLIFILLK